MASDDVTVPPFYIPYTILYIYPYHVWVIWCDGPRFGVDAMSVLLHILVCEDGLSYGPFTSIGEANEWGEDNLEEPWLVYPLMRPTNG